MAGRVQDEVTECESREAAGGKAAILFISHTACSKFCCVLGMEYVLDNAMHEIEEV
jgi:hypothetical protein